MEYWYFCEVAGQEQTGHFAGGFYSDRTGNVDVAGFITAEDQVFFTSEEPKFCPFTGKPLKFVKP
jgi:hypothetical protein